MDVRTHLVESLRRLCLRAGGHRVVADAIGADEQSLQQILKGVKLPSGNAKGVGPTLQRKLDSAYPGWSSLPETQAGTEPQQGDRRPAEQNWPFRLVSRDTLAALDARELRMVEGAILQTLADLATSTKRQNSAA